MVTRLALASVLFLVVALHDAIASPVVDAPVMEAMFILGNGDRICISSPGGERTSVSIKTSTDTLRLTEKHFAGVDSADLMRIRVVVDPQPDSEVFFRTIIIPMALAGSLEDAYFFIQYSDARVEKAFVAEDERGAKVVRMISLP